ncbi:octanoyltransferase [Virgibacillus dakarensis]|uniref:Octanoyl-[GcvH]:protein N-octanoyltransferase n=1 Tax=Lentibacillus populi TaxID=1827502 RepID=A0A9W5TVT6_9BACI|nr:MULTISPECIES: lipoate--protein ligase family protein [Bacillaceae]MBT2215267.1 lipoate--protein ligase family protein [Virgibacillus dakarensis]MTW86094.1 octanoyltransferase [Virgibacillus dakarensis]GGB34995.1 octanoyl-[GcvH]:protein N-octanoyltransferase [Lentibacillus populi]
MKTWKDIIRHTTFRYIDQSNEAYIHNVPISAMVSFAIDDALATSVSDGISPPSVRLWVHPNTVVLGIPDARLPFIEHGISMLQKQGYQAVVRNSGGLAVALDDGVLNISLILPGVRHISIYECYEAMVSFVQYILSDLTDNIKAYEIVGSYCPGDYDLSIDGRKFAGISQRRIKDGAAIQIYLDVEGSSFTRAALIRKFYDVSLQGAKTKFTYPAVDPTTMASLSELLGMKLTVDDIKRRVHTTLEALSDEVVETDFSESELATFQTRLKQMKKRNEFITQNGLI